MSMVLTQGKCHSLNAECHEKQLKKRKKKKKQYWLGDIAKEKL